MHLFFCDDYYRGLLLVVSIIEGYIIGDVSRGSIIDGVYYWGLSILGDVYIRELQY